MHPRFGRVVAVVPPDESASNYPLSTNKSSLLSSLDLFHGLETNLQRIHSETHLSSKSMSLYEEPEDRRANHPSNSAILIECLCNLIGLGNPSARTKGPYKQEVNSIMADEPTSNPHHLEIMVSYPFDHIEVPLAKNGMTLEEVQQIQKLSKHHADGPSIRD